jgi:hypothetical protein
MNEPRKEVALRHEILRGVVGSTCHGTAIEGQDDRDEMGIFVEPPEYVCGLKTLDHYIYRTQPEGVRSGLLTFGEALAEIQAAEDRLRQIVNECELEADYERVNEFLCAAHRARWGW